MNAKLLIIAVLCAQAVLVLCRNEKRKGPRGDRLFADIRGRKSGGGSSEESNESDRKIADGERENKFFEKIHKMCNALHEMKARMENETSGTTAQPGQEGVVRDSETAPQGSQVSNGEENMDVRAPRPLSPEKLGILDIQEQACRKMKEMQNTETTTVESTTSIVLK